jgi:hypothetical protein
MGTLGNQPPRDPSIGHILKIIKEMGWKFDTMTPEKWHAACEVTRTALAIENADALDEQLGGFGEILNRLCDVIEGLSQTSE